VERKVKKMEIEKDGVKKGSVEERTTRRGRKRGGENRYNGEWERGRYVHCTV
jgi:hypothetical protein